MSVSYSSSSKTRQKFFPATIAVFLIGCFAFIIVLLHFLRTDYNPWQRFISEYEVGDYGIIMRIAFFCLGAGSIALVVSLWLNIEKHARSNSGLALLFIWSMCVCTAAVFPADARHALQTTAGKIHDNVSLLGFVCIIISSFLLLRFRKDVRWKMYYKVSLLLSVLILAAFIALITSIITEFTLIGLMQRIFILLVLTWLIKTTRAVQIVYKRS